MDLNLIQDLLKDKELNQLFPDLVSLIEKRISDGEICSGKISENKYSSEHYLNIYISRLKYAQKKQRVKYYGLKKSIDILSQHKGFLIGGYINTLEEHIIIFFSEDLRKIVALFKVSEG